MAAPSIGAASGDSIPMDVASSSSSTARVDLIMKGWFSEVNSQWPGQAMSLQVESVLFEQKSEYQHVLVFQSTTWGKVLVLDGVIQLTERDEMAYQEMIAHLPLFAHPNPEHLLIIGGGDGGVIREAVKHASLKSITICEIDRVVIEAGKKYFPSVAAAWDDPRVTLHEGDGAVFMKKEDNIGRYDVIVTDSSDPIGPAQSLFESPFYQAMHAALRPGGKVCTQAESIWINLPLIQQLVSDSLQIYANAEYATTQIPTYPAGQIGFLLCSKEKEASGRRGSRGSAKPSCATPARKMGKGDADKFKFYTPQLHAAAFVLPAFVTRAIDEARTQAAEKKAGKGKETASANGSAGAAEAGQPSQPSEAEEAKVSVEDVTGAEDKEDEQGSAKKQKVDE